MNPEIANQLLELNYQFYQSFAESFAATRQRLQPGVQRVLQTVATEARVLDLGCGSGEVARQLGRDGFQGSYVGLDFSAGLLAEAQDGAPDFARFRQADLAAADWDAGLDADGYDVILAFAVMHHLPGEALRLAFLGKVGALLAPGGRFIHSNWQFMSSERLRSRRQPWARAGLDEADVDPGDYLLDWRRDGEGLRYVHQYGEEELAGLAAQRGFKVVETFYSDGEGGKLGLYGVWEGA